MTANACAPGRCPPPMRHHADSNRLAWTLGLAALYMAAELIGGYLANSLALLADAGHMLTDVAALGMGLFAVWIARQPASPEKTYGYYRAEILAALANGATLVGVSIWIFVEAYQRFRQPPQVVGATMMAIAIGGLVVNIIMMAILHGGHAHSLNLRSIWLHVAADAAGSVGTIVAGVLILTMGWNWADPLASVVIGILIVISSWRILVDAVAVLMESAPGHIDLDQVRRRLMSMPGVADVHDLHVWTITSNFEALTVHVMVEDWHASESLLAGIRHVLDQEFSVKHVTIQLEPPKWEQ